MNEKIKDLKDLQNKQKLYILLFVVYMLSMLYVLYRSPIVGLCMHLLGFFFYIFFIMKKDRIYKTRIKKYTFEEGLRPYIKNITYIEKDGVSKEDLLNPAFIPCSYEKSLLSRDTVTGTYKNCPVVFSDVVSMIDSKIPNKKGVLVEGKDHLIGVYASIKSDKLSGASFTIWPKKSLPDEVKARFFDTSALNNDVHELSKNYNLLLGADTDASALTPEFVKAFLQLADNTTGDVACQMTDGQLRFFIIHRFMYNVTVKFKAEMTPQLLNFVSFPEIAHITRVIDSVM